MSNINTNSEIALTKIKSLITQNKLLKGNKLPNERLLSDITNSKRAHVRNALLILEKDPEDILRNYAKMPQVNINVDVDNKDILSDSDVQKKIKEIESDLTVGRVLVRPSGTESKIRVMVESDDGITATKYAKDIAAMFRK